MLNIEAQFHGTCFAVYKMWIDAEEEKKESITNTQQQHRRQRQQLLLHFEQIKKFIHSFAPFMVSNKSHSITRVFG